MKSCEIKKVLEKGEKIKNPLFNVYFLFKDQPILRVDYLVSKKLFKKAVLRNRIKRILREIGRKNLKKDAKVDAVVLPKKGIEKKRFSEIEKEFLKVFKKIIT